MKLKEHKSTLVYVIIIIINVTVIALYQILYPETQPNLKLEALRLEYSKEIRSSVDHTKFDILKKNMKTPQDVTKACISCHTERHTEVMESSHWNWDRVDLVEGKGFRASGKKNVMNNFCTGVAGNELACASCHTGVGMADVKDFDFKKPENVDCLSCHASPKAYQKSNDNAGFPALTVNLNLAAISVGKPSIENCGNCHFYGGGGNNVKHGDLEEALLDATREIDVHLAKNGINMTCVDCHTAENHKIKGRLYSVSTNNVSRALCSDCHSETPHQEEMLNTHSAKVACQTCHIPIYAKVNPTKLSWKWSDAGMMDKDGKPFKFHDGDDEYMSIKGSFKWGTNVVPEYVWFNGTAENYVIGDKIDPANKPIQMNKLNGSHNDPNSKIIPVKVHRGDQIYDTQNNMLIQAKLYSKTPGDSAYWKDFDWNAAAEKGMRDAGFPYSGHYDFIETEMYWPLNHMVSKKTASLQCADCHTPKDGRLASLTGFYLPGRDRNDWLDLFGMLMIVGAVLGVFAHSGLRIYTYFKNEKEHEMPHYDDFDKSQD